MAAQASASVPPFAVRWSCTAFAASWELTLDAGVAQEGCAPPPDAARRAAWPYFSQKCAHGHALQFLAMIASFNIAVCVACAVAGKSAPAPAANVVSMRCQLWAGASKPTVIQPVFSSQIMFQAW